VVADEIGRVPDDNGEIGIGPRGEMGQGPDDETIDTDHSTSGAEGVGGEEQQVRRQREDTPESKHGGRKPSGTTTLLLCGLIPMAVAVHAYYVLVSPPLNFKDPLTDTVFQGRSSPHRLGLELCGGACECALMERRAGRLHLLSEHRSTWGRVRRLPPQPWGFRNAPKLLSYGTKTIQEGLANSDVPLLSRTSTSRVGSASYGATSYGAVATVEEEAQLDPFSSASDADDSDD
jgi:hypothetical protein